MKKVGGVLVVVLIALNLMAFDLQNFYTPFGDEGFALTTSDVLGHLQLWAGNYSNYSQNPFELEFYAPGQPEITKQIVDYYFVNQFGVAFGFFDFLQLGVGASYNRPEGHKIPLTVKQGYGFETGIPGLWTDEKDTSFWAGYLGDIRLQLKGQILEDKPKSIGIAVATEFTFPTNPDNIDFYMTFGGFTTAGFLVIQKTFDTSILSLTLAGNWGLRYIAPVEYTYEDLETNQKQTITIDYVESELPGTMEWRGGIIVIPAGLRQLSVNLEAVGRHFDPDPTEDYGKDIGMSNSVEALLGVGYKFGFGLKLSAAGGTSIIKDIGGPDFRALLGLSFTYPYEKKKKAVAPKEDWDNDGIPNNEELRRGLDPNDPDTDRDGLDDGNELASELNPKEPDTDYDGLTDYQEIYTFATNPNKSDTDGDGLFDGQEIELRSDPKKSDTDGDKIIDSKDGAPAEAETINGFQDDDGIPEREIIRLDSGLVLYDRGLYISKNILFKEGSATEVLKESLPVLQDLQKLMEGYPTLVIRLVGHADPDERGDREALAQNRAEMVKKFLISRGISEDRIQVVGRGSQNPVDKSGNAEKRKLNQRVEVEMVSL